MRTESRMLGLMGAFGFSSGLPLLLTLSTLQQWFTSYGISLQAIALTSWIGVSYTLKFLWSPVFDRLPPGKLRALGRRRGWLLPVQVALVSACFALASTNPGRDARLTVLCAVMLAFFSASQDILIDAWRIESFAPERQGEALAAYIWGYRGAMLTSGSGALWLSTRAGWHVALTAVAALLALGPLVTWLAPEPSVAISLAAARGWRDSVERAFLAPLRNFLTRRAALRILLFVVLFKLGKVFADNVAAPFYRYGLGFNQKIIAYADLLGLAGTLAGAAIGGLLVLRLGAVRALLLAGAIQGLALGLYLMLLWTGDDPRALAGKVMLEALAGAMADATFLAYLSSLCSAAFTATQYALLSSLAALVLHTLGGFAGYAAGSLGYPAFYTATMLASAPALMLLLQIRRSTPTGPGTAREVPADSVVKS